MIKRLSLRIMHGAGFTTKESFPIMKKVCKLNPNKQFDFIELLADEGKDTRFEKVLSLMIVKIKV